nr:TRAP transporter large permease subunit [Marinicella sp. W31]MDC2876165.1 TRAP transporter large permease subunit [Marinicella sp. W31]
MSPLEIGGLAIAGLLILIYVGMPIGVSMLFVSFIGVSAIRGETVSMRMLGAVANNSLREYLYAIVPLFVLMGLLVTISKVGKDTFDVFQKLMGRITAGLGIATVFANAVFAAITGVSIASATVFSRVAVPEMTRHGYTAKFATGVVAGLVRSRHADPAVIADDRLCGSGRGIGWSDVPRGRRSGHSAGLCLLHHHISLGLAEAGFRLYGGKTGLRGRRNRLVGAHSQGGADRLLDGSGARRIVWRFLNPTEAGAAGALGALLIALLRRSLTPRSFWRLLVETGQITVSVLFLILAATFFSRMLALSGVPRFLAETLLSGPIGPYGFLLLYLLLIIALGCLIDSISIMLILLPIALPVADAAGFDLIWFGVLTVVAVEVGLLTPPFGLSVYIIKSAIADQSLKVSDIFRGALPFVGAMLVSLALIVAFPSIATWLARL